MIVLDTNVVSEMMRARPSLAVSAWLNDQETPDLYITAVTVAEVAYGLMAMPVGERRRRLELEFRGTVEEAFEDRILSLDLAAAYHFGEIMAHRRSRGRPMSLPDGLIAACARSRGFSVATRNIKDFDDCGLRLIDPFEARPS